MIAVISAALLAAAPCPNRARCTEIRLSNYIVERNPKAQPYALELAQRIVLEARRWKIPVSHLAAVAWIESDYRRGTVGKAHEVGIWQLRPFDHYLPAGWRYVRSMPGEFTLEGCRVGAEHRAKEWRRLPRRMRECIIDDVRAGTYLAGLELRKAIWICRAKGHRVGAYRCNKPMINDCRTRWHAHAVDRLGHYNSGGAWPPGHYVAKLRRRSRRIEAQIKPCRDPAVCEPVCRP